MFYAAFERYLDRPTFRHGIDAVPFIVHGPTTARRWARSGIDADDPRFATLFWSLKRWTAFLGGGYRSHAQMRARLAAILPAALKPILELTGRGAGNIADANNNLRSAVISSSHMISFYVKASQSPVLGSKALHLLLPSLVPAYDNAVVREQVLPMILARGREFPHYLEACRVALGALAMAPRRRGLERARQLAWKHLRDEYLRQIGECGAPIGPWRLDPPTTVPDPRLLDSYVAEYAVIGLSRAGQTDGRQVFQDVRTMLDEL